jgi:hypothetical protein
MGVLDLRLHLESRRSIGRRIEILRHSYDSPVFGWLFSNPLLFLSVCLSLMHTVLIILLVYSLAWAEAFSHSNVCVLFGICTIWVPLSYSQLYS